MRKRIIIVDDDEPSRFLFRVYLGRVSGLEIVGEFANGEDALSQIPHLAPNAAIVDYTLPGMSGLEFAKELGQYPEIKILLVTAHDSDFMKTKLASAPNVDFVQKSWSEEALEHIIRFCKGGLREKTE